MKKIFQLSLFFLLLFLIIAFYFAFLQTNKDVEQTKIGKKDNDNSLENKNNLIKNLKYNVNFDNNTQYTITADLSELRYENDVELVDMRNVVAIFSDEKNIPLKITSNQALYNNSNYNSNFSENVKVEYLDNVVLSDKLDINFGENIIKIYENVVYEGLQGTIKADNVVLNLITKNMKIFMQTKGEKVEVLSK
jgi:LPS export ABC transporter protein LptC